MDKTYLEKLESIKTVGECIQIAIKLSNKDNKEVANALGIDAAVFSRIIKGTQWFKPEKIKDFCELTGNTLLIDWLCHQCGGRFMNHNDENLKSEDFIKSIVRKEIEKSNLENAELFKQASETFDNISKKLKSHTS